MVKTLLASVNHVNHWVFWSNENIQWSSHVQTWKVPYDPRKFQYSISWPIGHRHFKGFYQAWQFLCLSIFAFLSWPIDDWPCFQGLCIFFPFSGNLWKTQACTGSRAKFRGMLHECPLVLANVNKEYMISHTSSTHRTWFGDLVPLHNLCLNCCHCRIPAYRFSKATKQKFREWGGMAACTLDILKMKSY